MGPANIMLYPNTGHAITDVRFSDDFVRFTPESGHFRHSRLCPLLANNSRSAKANKTLLVGSPLSQIQGSSAGGSRNYRSRRRVNRKASNSAWMKVRWQFRLRNFADLLNIIPITTIIQTSLNRQKIKVEIERYK